MSKILLLHLSDMHYGDAGNSTKGRVDQIVSSVRNIQHGLDAVLIIVSGDLSNTGADCELAEAWELIQSLKDGLASEPALLTGNSTDQIHVIAVPGNHDCDLRNESEYRKAYLSDQIETGVDDQSIAQMNDLLSVQTAFFEYRDAFGAEICDRKVSVHERIAWSHEFLIGDARICVHCLNTAWMSTRREKQGKLQLPAASIPVRDPKYNVSIAVLHHPYNWINANVTYELRPELETFADLIFSGHEHSQFVREQVYDSGISNLWFESGAFQVPNDDRKSEFGIVLVDLDTQSIKSGRLRWDGASYVFINKSKKDPDFFGLEWVKLANQEFGRNDDPRLSDYMSDWLDSIDLPLGTKSGYKVKLGDVFVYPDLDEITSDGSTSGRMPIRSDQILEETLGCQLTFVQGDRESGKSSLAKIIFRDAFHQGMTPIFVDADELLGNKHSISKYLAAKIEEQYFNLDAQKFGRSAHEKKLLIIDDFDDMVKSESVATLLEKLSEQFSRIIAVGDRYLAQVVQIGIADGSGSAIIPNKAFTIKPLGHSLRRKLIENWKQLEPELRYDPIRLAQSTAIAKDQIDMLVGKEWMPALPTYILAMLQISGDQESINMDVGSQGAFYDALIRSALLRSTKQPRFNISYGFLSEFAFGLYRSNSESVNINEFDLGRATYATSRDLRPRDIPTQASLIEIGILAASGNQVRFRHRYIYLYFVAIALRDRISTDSVRQEIAELVDTIGHRDSSSVLLFLAHVAAEEYVVRTLLVRMRGLFADQHCTDMESDLPSIASKWQRTFQTVVLDPDVKSNRETNMRSRDEREQNSQDNDDSFDGSSEFMDAVRAIEVVGQLLRNFPATLDSSAKSELVRESVFLTRRMLGFFYEIVGEMLEFWFDSRKNTTIGPRRETDLQMKQKIESMAQHLIEMITYGLIEKTSSAIGTEQLEMTFGKVLSSQAPLPEQLIRLTLEQRFSPNYPRDLTESLIKRTNEYSLGRQVLRWIVISHFYLFESDRLVRVTILNSLGTKHPQRISPRARIAKS